MARNYFLDSSFSDDDDSSFDSSSDYSSSISSDSDTSINDCKRKRGESSKMCKKKMCSNKPNKSKNAEVEVDNRKEYQLFGVFHEGLFKRLDRARDVIEIVRDETCTKTFSHGGVKYYLNPIVLGESVADIKQWLQEADYYKDFSVRAVSISR